MERFINSLFLYDIEDKMGQVLENILEGCNIRDFSIEWIKNTTSDDKEIMDCYKFLKKIGLDDNQIATQANLLCNNPDTISKNYQNLLDLGLSKTKIVSRASLLGMSSDTINRNYQTLLDLGLSKTKIATQASLLGNNPDTISKNYQNLLDLGLSKTKIALRANLLTMNPDTISKNYQNHIGLIRENYQDRNSGKEILLKKGQCLDISPCTLEANIQWLKDKNISFVDGILLSTKPQTKRKKLSWILREIFDYRSIPKNNKNETIEKMYHFVRDNNNLLVRSIGGLEEIKCKLREKAEFYK